MTIRLVQSRSIESAKLYRYQPWYYHGYVIPFGLIDFGLIIYYMHGRFQDEEKDQMIFWVGIMVNTFIQMVVWLSCHWSIEIRSRMMYYPVNIERMDQADHVRIITKKDYGQSGWSPLEKVEWKHKDGTKENVFYFYFQKRKYVCRGTSFLSQKKESEALFEKVDFPLHHEFEYYQENEKGYFEEETISLAQQKYGENILDIPLPTFGTLFKEHSVAPFFVFQVFCIGLWCLDEYWYYSIFTLFMLVVFESTVVYQRLRNLKELRKMTMKPYKLHVRRMGRWIMLGTNELLPGDICSMTRGKDDQSVPCDMVLLHGTCIVNEAMLTGESTPQLKESIVNREKNEVLDVMGNDRRHVVFGGTKIVQTISPEKEETNIRASDNGCIGFVLQTGFHTSQGKLMRTILFNTERVTANNLESLFFILFLLIFALMASGYVFIKGLEDVERSRYKLVLECILIITSVVPPELPMELALAVNASLAVLAKSMIFCTEPFRIPFAGKIDICCFDKTGTLTSENLVVAGFAGISEPFNIILTSENIPEATQIVVAGCHSLAYLDNDLIGDPLEKSAVEAIQWSLTKAETMISKSLRNVSIKIMRRFQFTSALKRMSAIVNVDKNGQRSNWIVVKGAPEVVKNMINHIPKDFENCFKMFSKKGFRVLALAFRKIDENLSTSDLYQMARHHAESDLVFAGFLLFHCPLKLDSYSSLTMIAESSHSLAMITGDNPLTGCHVSKELGIIRRHPIILDVEEKDTTSTSPMWKDIDETHSFPIDFDGKIQTIFEKFDLCVTGNGLTTLMRHGLIDTLLPNIRVFARVSPEQKEYILLRLKRLGYTTLMCGDGTNDVGALKQAHVGIALLHATQKDLDELAERRKRHGETIREQLLKSSPQSQQQTFLNSSAAPRPSFREKLEQLQKAKKMMEELEENEAPLVQLGDASIAAPFTSKLSSVKSVCDIIRQGRCALVTTIQMYKILALNCLISAYSMSVLYLAGVRFSDSQATISGMLIASCFLFLSRAEPLKTLSRKRPQSNVFNKYIIPSILGQFAIHVYALIYIMQLSEAYEPSGPINIKSIFKPSLLNSSIYILSLSMQVSTFAVNYQGRPFREDLWENKPLFKSLSIVQFIAIFTCLELSRDINNFLELVPFQFAFRIRLFLTLVFDIVLAWSWEKLMEWLFSDSKPKSSLVLNHVQ